MEDIFFSKIFLQIAGGLGFLLGFVQILPSMRRRAAERGLGAGMAVPLCFMIIGFISFMVGSFVSF